MAQGMIGILAGALTSTALIPQLVKMMREKNSDGVALGMLLILISGLSLWIWYGFLKKDWPIIFTNCFAVFINLWTLVLRIKYKRNKG